jgi:hypothetical protein
MAGHADHQAALVDLLIDELQLGIAGRTLLAIFGVRETVLDAGNWRVSNRHGLAVAALDEKH